MLASDFFEFAVVLSFKGPPVHLCRNSGACAAIVVLVSKPILGYN
jgi:hypothetical protein